MTSILFK